MIAHTHKLRNSGICTSQLMLCNYIVHVSIYTHHQHPTQNSEFALSANKPKHEIFSLSNLHLQLEYIYISRFSKKEWRQRLGV